MYTVLRIYRGYHDCPRKFRRKRIRNVYQLDVRRYANSYLTNQSMEIRRLLLDKYAILPRIHLYSLQARGFLNLFKSIDNTTG